MLQMTERALRKAMEPISRGAVAIAGVLLMVMVVIVLVQIFLRYILKTPIGWVNETSIFLMIYMTYLSLPLIYLQDKNIAMTFFLNRLEGKRVYNLLLIFIHLIALLVFTVWIYFGIQFYQTGAVRADSLPIKMYVIYIAPPAMMIITSLTCIQKIITELNNFIHYQQS